MKKLSEITSSHKHKLEDGDVFKILPILKRDGDMISHLNVRALYENGSPIVFETNATNFLSNIYYNYRKRKNLNTNLNFPVYNSSNYFFIYLSGAVKYIRAGKTLSDIIESDKESTTFNSDKFLSISIADKYGYSDFSKSKIIRKENTKFKNFSEVEMLDFLKLNQPLFIEDIFKEKEITNNLTFFKEKFEGHLSPEFISFYRDKQIDNILL